MTQRVIKFRAWDGKTMFYPSQITFGECGWHVEKGRGVSVPYQPHVILMQFTGKVDKNGTELYEGDIYRYSYEYDSDYDGDMPIVKTSTGVAVIKDIFDTYWIKRAKEEGGTVERLGDIYTTPELVDPKMIER